MGDIPKKRRLGDAIMILPMESAFEVRIRFEEGGHATLPMKYLLIEMRNV